MRKSYLPFLLLSLGLTLAGCYGMEGIKSPIGLLPGGEVESPPAAGPGTNWEAQADHVIATGLAYLGAPYQLGGKWHLNRSFDCSNFVAHVFKEALGMEFTTSSRGQASLGEPVALGELRKGDLLFFWTPSRGRDEVGHVAIYMGNNTLLHTYREGIGVTITGFSDTWWEDHYLFARRILTDL